MNYIYSNKISFFINHNVVSKFLNYIATYDFKIESGGIIVGQLNPADNQIIATDITEPYAKDKCTTLTFKRSEFGHQEIMNDLWETSGHTKTYLGEWHTHNQRVPQPSCIDTRNWIKISKRRQNSTWLFFIIIGTDDIGVWTIHNNKVVQMTDDNIFTRGDNYE